MFLKPNQDRAKFAMVLLYLIIFVSVAFAFSNYSQLVFLREVETGNYAFSDAESNDTRQQFIAIILVLLNIISAVTFIMWFRRAYHNLQLAGETTKYENGWAAGAWFVPFLNLYRPYEMMKELFVKSNWKINETLGGEGDQKFGVKIGMWWAFWIIQNVFGTIINRLPGESTIAYFKNITSLTIIDCTLTIISGIFAIMVIKSYKDQEILLEEAATIQVEEIGKELVSE